MVKQSFLISLICIATVSSVSMAAPLVLTPKDVAERVLSQSYVATEVNLRSQLARFDLALAMAEYDFTLQAESGYLMNKFETSAGFDKNEQYTTGFSLQKPFITGTTLGLEYDRLSNRYDFPSTATNPVGASTEDIFGITLKQNLIQNSFGMADRARVRAAEANFEAAGLVRANDLQALVLNAIRSFWNTYVAQETFQESLNSRDRYKKLVDVVKRKTSYGGTGPGELSQTQAELETREQTVKIQSLTYLTALDQLTTLLRIPPGTEIRLQIPEDVPPLPKMSTADIEKLRVMRALRLRRQASEDAYKAARSNSYPDLSLIGRLYSQGLEEKSDDANSEMVSGTNPQYFVGLQLTYNFGSGYQNEDELNKKILRDLAQSELDRSILEVKDQEASLERRVQSAYSNALSAKNERNLREKAAQELNRSYTQGRTDISVLIDSINKYFDSIVKYARYRGEYQIALNEWAAFRDELIPEVKEVKE